MGPKSTANNKGRTLKWPRQRQQPRERDSRFGLVREDQGQMIFHGDRDDERREYMEQENNVTEMRGCHGFYHAHDNMGGRRREYNPDPGGRVTQGRIFYESDLSAKGGLDSFPIHGGGKAAGKREYDRFPRGERSTGSASHDFGRVEDGRIFSSKREFCRYAEDYKHTVSAKREPGRFPPGQRKGATPRKEYEIIADDRSVMSMRRGYDGFSNFNRGSTLEKRESGRFSDGDRRSGLVGRRGNDGFVHGDKGGLSHREHHGRVFDADYTESDLVGRNRESVRYGEEDSEGMREYTRRIDVEEGKWQRSSHFSQGDHIFSSYQWEQVPLENESRNMDSSRHESSRMNRERGYMTNNCSDSDQHRELSNRGPPTFHPEMNIRRGSGVDNDLLSVGRFHKDDGLRFPKNGGFSGSSSNREMLDHKDGLRFPLNDNSHYGMHTDNFSSQTQVLPQRSLSIAHDGGFSFPRCGISNDVMGQERVPKTNDFLETRACNLINFGPKDCNNVDNPYMDQAGSELWHCESGIQEGYYQNPRSVHLVCGKHNPLVKAMGDNTTLPGSSSEARLGDGGHWDRHGYDRMSGSIDPRMTGMPILHDREAPRNQLIGGAHESEVQKYEELHTEKGFVCDRERYPYDREQRLRSSPLREWSQGGFRGLPEKMMPLTEVFDQEMLGRKEIDLKPIKRKFKTKFVSRHKTFGRINMAGRRNAPIIIENGFHGSDRYTSMVPPYADRGDVSINETPIQRVPKRKWFSSSNLSRLRPRRFGLPNKSSVSDIKKRLKATSYNLHVSKYKGQKSLSTKPINKRLNIVESDRIMEGGSSSGSKGTPVKAEPPEGSDEFRQLVQISFLKFVKQLYENPDQIGKYKDEGGVCALKCSVCGSGSEEFGETQRLAEHTWECGRGGKASRVHHSGLHRALCFVMGWSEGAAEDGRRWEMVQLTEEEAASQRDDLIIWPPVVLVHHSLSADISSPTPDSLRDHLREEGFGGGKVVEGGGGVKVVGFSGTLSGFQEAERVERWLGERSYCGKLGVAADVEQVDAETRKRWVVKSKRDILAIAHTPITL